MAQLVKVLGNEKGKSIDFSLNESKIAQPVDIQARYSKTIQTHSGVTIAPSSGNASAWFNCEGFSDVAITLAGASKPINVLITWSQDGLTAHGEESLLNQASVLYRAGSVNVKAKYFRFYIINGDTSPVTVTAHAYLTT